MKKSVLTFLIFLVCTLLFSLQAQNITAYVSGTATTYAIADLTEATANTAGNLANADSIVVSNTWTAANLLTLQKAMKATWSSTNSTTNSTLQKVDMRAVTLSGTGFTSFIGPAGFGYLFSSCTALTSVILPNTTTSTDVSFRSAFNGCTKLQKVENLDKFTKITDLEAAFQNCEALDSVRLGTNPNSLGSGYLGYTFTNTKVACLKYLPAGVNTIPQTWVSAGYKNFVLPITVGEVTVETYTAGSAMSLAVPELTYAYCASTDTTWQLSADNTFATIASEWNVTAQHTAQASEDGYYLRCAITAPHRSGSGDTVYYAAPQQITVAAIPSVANLTTPAAICSGEALALTTPTVTDNNSAVTGQGWQISGDNFTTVSTYTAGQVLDDTYNNWNLRYYATNTCGTGYSDTVMITVNPQPTVSLSATETAICPGSSTTLTASATDYTTLKWYADGVELTDSINETSITVSPTSTTTYKAVAVNEQTVGSETITCEAEAEQEVAVVTQPTVSLSATKAAICNGSSTTLTVTATDYTGIKWYSNGVKLTESINETSITVSPTATTTYKAVAVNTVSDIYAKGAKATAADIAIGDIVTTDSLLVKPADWAKLAAAGKVAAGVVYHVNDDLTRVVGLDEGRSILWGFSGTDIPGLTNRTNDADALADFSGQSNTAAILAYNATLGTPLTASQSAAVWANAQGGYLPAAGELTAMMNNRTAINTTLQAISGTQISNNWFWSSSEYGTTSAWLVTSDGSLYSALKNYVCYVRSALAFPSIYLFNNLTISCESEAELEVVVNKTYNITESKTVCTEALPYTWNGVVFTEAGTKVAALQTKNGCDSTVTMTLTAIKLTIDSEEDLVDFRDAINDGTDAKQYKGVTLANGGAGMYFTLTADLDLSGICYRVDGTTTNDKSWRRIGSAVQPASPFQGSFDGGGHTIDNLYINAIYFNHGLFGKIENATVKNLSLTNAYIEGYGYLGGITGEMSHSEISYCHVSGIIKMEENQYRDYFAGICGTASDSSAINYCTVSGSVSGTQRVGGICGYISGEGSLINGCTNLADVTASVQYVGGIVSYVNGQAKITNCVNAGSVHNLQTNYTGGIAGDLFSFSNVSPKTRIENCLNVGNVTHDGPYGQGVVYGSVYGGISSSEVINCYYDKQMSTESQFGYNSSVEVESNHEGSLTSALVGEGLKGIFPDSVWVFTDNMYPRIKQTANTDVSVVAAAPVFLFADDDSYQRIDTVYTDFKVGKEDDVLLSSHEGFLTILDNSVSIACEYGVTDTLTMERNTARRNVPMAIYKQQPDIDTIDFSMCENKADVVLDLVAPIAGTWVSSDESVAEITASGEIVPQKAGTVLFSYIATQGGCKDSVRVNVLPVYQHQEQVVICDNNLPYTWRGTEYSIAGVYYDSLQTLAGCDSVYQLKLTVNKTLKSEFSQVACDSYTWNEQTYTTSGDYEQTFTSANGCDSIVTLHLTINKTLREEISEKSCDSYTWNEQTYTTSGDYEQTFTSANGCDSIVTLHLTIGHPVLFDKEDMVYLGAGYNKDGFDIPASAIATEGVYSFEQHLLSQYGCDSVVVLSLIVKKEEQEIVLLQINTSKDHYCEGDEAFLSYQIASGSPLTYELDFDDQSKAEGFRSVSGQIEDVLTFSIPEGASAGKHTVTLQLFGEMKSSQKLSVTFSVGLNSDRIEKLWNDVVVCKNTDNKIASYQWYHEDELIEGATNQFYCDMNGLEGNYSVKVVTVNGDSLWVCEKYFERELPPFTIISYPNPAKPMTNFTVEVSGLDDSQMEKASLFVYTAAGVMAYTSNQVQKQNILALPTGEYVAVVTVDGGKSVSCKVTVLP